MRDIIINIDEDNDIYEIIIDGISTIMMTTMKHHGYKNYGTVLTFQLNYYLLYNY